MSAAHCHADGEHGANINTTITKFDPDKTPPVQASGGGGWSSCRKAHMSLEEILV